PHGRDLLGPICAGPDRCRIRGSCRPIGHGGTARCHIALAIGHSASLRTTVGRSATEVFEHKVIAVRATGVMPDVVAENMEQVLTEAAGEGWELQTIQPVIYNSATTGYLLLILRRMK